MAAPQNFRSAFNGFNREDVVHYLEYINTKHNNLVNQLTSENQELRAAAQQPAVEDQSELVESLQAQCEELTAQLEEEKNRCAELTGKLEALQLRCQELETQTETVTPAETISVLASEELEAYRRAERIEREARERSELIYFQASSVMKEADARLDGAVTELTEVTDQVLSQLTQLQVAASNGKIALQDAAAVLNTIRPNR